MYYPPSIREDAPSSSEIRDAPEEVEATSPRAALAITSSKEPAKESEPSGAVETNEGQNPDAPQETIGSTGDAPVFHAEGPVLLSSLFSPLLSSSRGEPRPGQRSRPPRVALVLYLFWCYVVVFLIFWTRGVCCNKAPFE